MLRPFKFTVGVLSDILPSVTAQLNWLKCESRSRSLERAVRVQLLYERWKRHQRRLAGELLPHHLRRVCCSSERVQYGLRFAGGDSLRGRCSTIPIGRWLPAVSVMFAIDSSKLETAKYKKDLCDKLYNGGAGGTATPARCLTRSRPSGLISLELDFPGRSDSTQYKRSADGAVYNYSYAYPICGG